MKDLFWSGTFVPVSPTMAYVAISRARKSKEGSSNEDEENILASYLLEFPAVSSRVGDLQIKVLLGRYVEDSDCTFKCSAAEQLS